MNVAADTSVLVAALASWHEHHRVALRALAPMNSIIGHCVLETYSVLTRLPAPHRLAAPDVVALLDHVTAGHPSFALSAAEQQALIARCAAATLTGGAIYDALIAATCTRHALRLLTLDARARHTYALLGADHTLLG